MRLVPATSPGRLVGEDVRVPTAGGGLTRYVDLDAAATSSSSVRVARAVQEFLPRYSSVHRGAGAKSRYTSARYEAARETVLSFVGADPATHEAVFVRNTTEALNALAFRLALEPDDVVLTTAVEHHANLLPWRRAARLRVVEVGAGGAFTAEDVVAALDQRPTPRVLALTGASNVTGWLPDLAAITAAARDRGVFVVVDAAQLAPHRPIDVTALGVDALALSGHKAYAPFGAGALVAPRGLLGRGEPLLVGGGAVRAVSFDDVVWAGAPDRDEAGSPNVVGAVALAAAAEELAEDWPGLLAHERALTAALDAELATVPGLRRLGPATGDRLPVAAFLLDDLPHGLVAARLSAEFGIGVRSGCFCAHPYMARLLELSEEQVRAFHDAARAGEVQLPGAVRASANRGTTLDDVAALGAALRAVAATPEESARYRVDERGEYLPGDARTPVLLGA
ncbi:aminotransferase class V-fold PLP-dependent enzyme [Geodermatophilus sp. SYSU D00525]